MVKNASAEQICSFTCRVLTCLRCTRDMKISGLHMTHMTKHKPDFYSFVPMMQNVANISYTNFRVTS
jgi:hypothetical protein